MIYDEFFKDVEWQRLSNEYHKPGLSYEQKQGLSAALDACEQRIRKQEKEKFNGAVEQYKSKTKGTV